MMKKQLTQSEIIRLLNQYEEGEAARKEELGVTPEQAERARTESYKPSSCKKCGELLGPYIERGAIRYACLACDEVT